MEYTLIVVIAVALFFDFTNGFHDTANAIATVISTKAVSPKLAVFGAAVLNFLGAFVSLNVAATVARGIVLPDSITLHTVLAGLIGAITWNLITWRAGLPSSSSHALIGGLVGAVVMNTGLRSVQWVGIQDKVLLPSLASPFIGLVGAAIILIIVLKIVERYPKDRVTRVFKRLQIVSGGLVAFAHGTNDAQKTMGVIVLALMATYPHQHWSVPIWVILASASAMALGTYTGGWRIIKTVGEKITHLTPQQGFAAETATAATLWLTSHFGLPISTTHTISGSILGAGTVVNHKAVNWQVVKHILIAWLITLPSAAVVGAGADLITRLPHSTGILLGLIILITITIYTTRNWTMEELAQVRNLMSILRQKR